MSFNYRACRHAVLWSSVPVALRPSCRVSGACNLTNAMSDVYGCFLRYLGSPSGQPELRPAALLQQTGYLLRILSPGFVVVTTRMPYTLRNESDIRGAV